MEGLTVNMEHDKWVWIFIEKATYFDVFVLHIWVVDASN